MSVAGQASAQELRLTITPAGAISTSRLLEQNKALGRWCSGIVRTCANPAERPISLNWPTV
jgi:hypothetical protein